MNKFDEEKYNAIPLAEKVQMAHDEIARLCGARRLPRREWTMCIPPQMDDSDMVIAGAIRALQAENERLRAFADEVRAIIGYEWVGGSLYGAIQGALQKLEEESEK